MTLLSGPCHIEKIIVSLPLSNLFLPNSNIFPLIQHARRKNTFSPNTKSSILYNLLSVDEVQMFIFDGVLDKNPV
jgi:hypothetical protein